MDAAEVEGVLEVLVMATTVESAETPSQFPQDLATTSNIIDMTVDFLMQDLSSNPDNPIPLSTVSMCTHSGNKLISAWARLDYDRDKMEGYLCTELWTGYIQSCACYENDILCC